MKKLIFIVCIGIGFGTFSRAENRLSKHRRPARTELGALQGQFDTVKRTLASHLDDINTFTKTAERFEFNNLKALLRNRINFLAAGTTASAPTFAQREAQLVKATSPRTRTLFKKLSKAAGELNPPSRLIGGSTISFQTETFLSGAIQLLEQSRNAQQQRGVPQTMLAPKKADKPSVPEEDILKPVEKEQEFVVPRIVEKEGKEIEKMMERLRV